MAVLGQASGVARLFDNSTGDLYMVRAMLVTALLNETYSVSILEFNTANFSLVAYWPVPSSQLGFDRDFGSTPTFFQSYY